jgi:hypothetical protein
MHKPLLLGIVMIAYSITPVQAQLMDSSAVRGFAAGLGGGSAAITTNNARAMARTPYATMSPGQQSTLVTSMTNQGRTLEKTGKSHLAEQSYREALRVIAQRDGIGSAASVPVLKLLVESLKEQKNYDDAISNQKTIVLFAKKNVSMAPMEVITSQQKLAELYIAKHDLTSAETILKDVVAFANSTAEIPAETREACQSNLTKFTDAQNVVATPAEATSGPTASAK